MEVVVLRCSGNKDYNVPVFSTHDMFLKVFSIQVDWLLRCGHSGPTMKSRISVSIRDESCSGFLSMVVIKIPEHKQLRRGGESILYGLVLQATVQY